MALNHVGEEYKVKVLALNAAQSKFKKAELKVEDERMMLQKILAPEIKSIEMQLKYTESFREIRAANRSRKLDEIEKNINNLALREKLTLLRENLETEKYRGKDEAYYLGEMASNRRELEGIKEFYRSGFFRKNQAQEGVSARPVVLDPNVSA